ncbi:hypothetical protein ACHAW5_005625 [Stephanodiscus triporus]|uniref:Mitochondrial carrier protein n=1 Tax=Stephanodiscus triporus TaxID=2934178 RepID=A0ABD3PMZ8_9STRA
MSSSSEALTTTLQSLPREARNLLAGGLAGMLAKTAVAPVDRIKILYQVTSARFRLRDVPSVARAIIEREGLGALWKGNTATMMRVFPYSGIQFMVFDYCKRHFLGGRTMQRERPRRRTGTGRRTDDDDDDAGRATAAAAGGGEATPSDDRRRGGGEDKGRKGGLTPLESLQAGMIAGTVSVLLTYPLDMARAQLAVLRRERRTSSSSSTTAARSGQGPSGGVDVRSHRGHRGGRGIGYVLSASFQHGGFRGLYRGITPTILGILPYSGLAFTINEQAKRQITHVTRREPTTFERLMCGAMSGLFAQTLSYPLEVTRRRMQTIGIVPTTGSESAAVMVTQLRPSSADGTTEAMAASAGNERGQQQHQQQQSPEQSRAQQRQRNQHAHTPQQQHPQPQLQQQLKPSHPPSMITTMKRLFEEQGVRGFFKGVTMNWVKGPIAFSISFTAFDTIQGLIETDDERATRKGGHSAKVNISRRLTNNDD